MASLEAPAYEGGLTDVAGLRAGHFTHSQRPTGCTVAWSREARGVWISCECPVEPLWTRRGFPVESTPPFVGSLLKAQGAGGGRVVDIRRSACEQPVENL